MSRMEINALTRLVNGADAAGYRLPSELADAFRTYERLHAMTLEPPTVVELDTAAARVVAAAAAGEDPDLLAAASLVDQADTDRLTHEQAKRILERATEQAAHTATSLCADL